MRIAVIGGGYVGLVSGACLAEKGHKVIIVEQDESRAQQINLGQSPIHEAGLETMLCNNRDKRLLAITELDRAVQASDVILIAVGTPFDGNRIDLSQIEQASIQIGKALQNVDRYHVVAVKSTVVPGTTDELVLPLLAEYSGKRAGIDFGVGMNPEFLREGAAVDDFMHPDRIVIGGIDERSRQRLCEVYSAFAETPKLLVNNRSAEMIKYAANSLLATMISFSNEIGNICATLEDVDATEVLRGVKLDKRLSPTLADGTRVEPGINTYLDAGCGFGGSCFPKDVEALRAFATDRQVDTSMLDAVMHVNDNQPQKMLQLLQRHMPELTGKNLTILGLAFKPDTDDVRESPALPLIRALSKRGARVTAFDPAAIDNARAELADLDISYAESTADAIRQADAILLVTAWQNFKSLPALLAASRSQPIVIDGRRIIDPRAVSHYEGIGRGEHTGSGALSDSDNGDTSSSISAA